MLKKIKQNKWNDNRTALLSCGSNNSSQQMTIPKPGQRHVCKHASFCAEKAFGKFMNKCNRTDRYPRLLWRRITINLQQIFHHHAFRLRMPFRKDAQTHRHTYTTCTTAEEVRTEKKLSHILQGNQKVSTTMSKIKLFLHVRERAGRLIHF